LRIAASLHDACQRWQLEGERDGAGCSSSNSHFVSTAASERPAAGGLHVASIVCKKTHAAVVILVQAWRTDAAIGHWFKQPAAEFCHLWSSPQNTMGWLANVQLLPHLRCFFQTCS